MLDELVCDFLSNDSGRSTEAFVLGDTTWIASTDWESDDNDDDDELEEWGDDGKTISSNEKLYLPVCK